MGIKADVFIQSYWKLITGPLLFFFIWFLGSYSTMPYQASITLAITAWIAFWWITEPIPIPITSLLPLILFPLFGIMNMESTGVSYADKIIWLYIGGFLLAIAIEKWNLHQRIAFTIIEKVGNKPDKIILGFMLASGFLSMWISNTATAIMMLPMGNSVILHLGTTKNNHFAKALMLAIAYACSIGGMATIIGTPTNLVLAGIVEKSFGTQISFYSWFIFGFPLSIILMWLTWWYLTHIAFKLNSTDVDQVWNQNMTNQNISKPISYEEKVILIVFSITAFLWIFRPLVITPFLPNLNDSMIALIAATVLFIVPSKNQKGTIMNWESAIGLPWGIVLLFGGGLAIAQAFQVSGLADWIGQNLNYLHHLPLILVLLITVVLVNFLTEVTSNVATSAMILPVLSAVSLAMNIHPYTLMVGACAAASCAFMLPVATPPNAIVFGSEYLKVNDMAKTGFGLNIGSIFLITIVVYLVLPYIWDYNLYSFPENFIKIE